MKTQNKKKVVKKVASKEIISKEASPLTKFLEGGEHRALLEDYSLLRSELKYVQERLHSIDYSQIRLKTLEEAQYLSVKLVEERLKKMRRVIIIAMSVNAFISFLWIIASLPLVGK